MTIIPLTEAGLQSWQWHLANGIRKVDELGAALNLDLDDIDTGFPVMVPRPYLSRMKVGDRTDPLLLQVLPRSEELDRRPGDSRDPLLEQGDAMIGSGLIQKYQGRVLAIATSTCAVNCRYCFRRHFPYREQHADLEAMLDHVRSDESINELILSGGDPLIMTDGQLGQLMLDLEKIEHLTSIRIHTRLPVVIPQRISDELIEWTTRSEKPLVFVIHANHPNEIDESVENSMHRLRGAGATVLNQSVLLRGVNDSAEVLAELSRRLLRAGVLPYYLHLLDPVAGAGHFDVPESEAQLLMKSLTEQLPGYLVPRLVREQPGERAKSLRFP